MAKTRKPLCAHPWVEIVLTNDKGFQPCCHLIYKSDSFPANREELLKLWNSPEMVDLRRRLIEGDIADLHCAHCLKTNTFVWKDVPKVGEDRQSLQPIIKKAQAAFEAHQTELDYTPLEITLGLSHNCNLRCIMCTQSTNDSDFSNQYPTENIIRTIQDVGWENVAVFGFSGGEALINKDGLLLLDFLKEHPPQDTTVYVVTNGTRLAKHVDTLNKINRLILHISIDGYGSAYEKIRAGGTWDQILENLEAIQQPRRDHPKWEVVIISIVMRSSLSSLVNLIELAKEKSDRIDFMRIAGPFFNENVFIYPSLLPGTKWHRHFEEAIAAAEKYSMDQSAQALRLMYEELKKSTTQPDAELLDIEWARLTGIFNQLMPDWQMAGASRDKKERHKDLERAQALYGFLRWRQQTGTELSDERIIDLMHMFKEIRAKEGLAGLLKGSEREGLAAWSAWLKLAPYLVRNFIKHPRKAKA
ncbi:MAG: radical SAM protein [Desulfarculaceae bacterium]|nr:radical SAM protein [Desulfarculaceae bacterium]